MKKEWRSDIKMQTPSGVLLLQKGIFAKHVEECRSKALAEADRLRATYPEVIVTTTSPYPVIH